MFETPMMKRFGVTPAKLALVAVLAVVLVVVVVVQLSGGNNPAPKAAKVEPQVNSDRAARRSSPIAATGVSATSAGSRQPAFTPVALPPVKLADVVRHNPFQLPAHLKPDSTNDPENQTNPHNQQFLRELTSQKKGIVLMVGGEHVARIGATTLRPGDKFGGYRVSKIDATGVWLVDEREDSN
jgi:hypothetical protein